MASDNPGDAPHPVDIHVGNRIRMARVQQRLSQSELAARVGVSFQAIQKYETGEIRISASRLYEVAQALHVSPGSLFEDYHAAGAAQARGAGNAAPAGDGFDRREVMTLLRAYYGIRDKAVQRDILRLITRLGQRDAEDEARPSAPN